LCHSKVHAAMGSRTATKIEKQKECNRFYKGIFRNIIGTRFKSEFIMQTQSNRYRKLPAESPNLRQG
jgi:hypothetical protein